MKKRNLVKLLKNAIPNSIYATKCNNRIVFFYNNNKSITLIFNLFYISYIFIDNHNYISFGNIPFYNFTNYIVILLIMNKQFNIAKIEKSKEKTKNKIDYKRKSPIKYNNFINDILNQ